MQKNLNIRLGTRDYSVNINNAEFLAFLQAELEQIQSDDKSIEIRSFINAYLNTSRKLFLQIEENEKLKIQLKTQEQELLKIIEKLRHQDK